MNCFVRPVVFLVLVAGSSTLAFAKSRPTQLSADECGKAAKKACIKGDVGKGIDILGDLYVETGDITFVFNQGRCFQQNHRWEEALDRFNEFLRKARNLSQNEKDEVDRYIADCQSHLPAAQPPAVAARVTPPVFLTPRTKPAPSIFWIRTGTFWPGRSPCTSGLKMLTESCLTAWPAPLRSVSCSSG